MKIGLVSDIHGNFEALRVVLEKLSEEKVSRIYCLGDVAGYYCQINECCEALQANGVICLMGNHDWYLSGPGNCVRSRSANDCIKYQRNVITKDNLEWMRSFAISAEYESLRMVHGGWSDPIDEYLDPKSDYFNNLNGMYFSSGHTHIQSIHKFGNKTYCNPGSVGQPRDGDSRAAFAIFDGTDFQLFRVEYDVKKIFGLMKLAGFDDYYYGSLQTGAPRLHKPLY